MNHLQQPRHPSAPSSFSAEAESWLQPDYSPELNPRIIDVFIAALILTLITLTGCASATPNSQTEIPAPAVSVGDEVSSPLPPTTVPPSEPEPTFTPVPVSQAEAEPAEAVEEPASTSLQSLEDKIPLPVNEPEIGPITFALDVTQNYEPIEANLLFSEGITKVHAIFTYRDMQPGSTWERIWFLNDKEVARNNSVWAGPTQGVFDYFIDNGGRALPAGDWVLELHVDGQFRGLGVFVIEEAEAIGSTQ